MNLQKDSVLSTTDYNQFYLLPENRKISEAHVEALKKSINIQNRLHLHPIIVKNIGGKLWITDGQHRLAAAKSLQFPIYYLIENDPVETSIIIDQTQRPWRQEDYLKYYISQKKEPYIEFNKLINDYEMPLSILMSLYGCHTFNITKVFKSGLLSHNLFVKFFCIDTYDMRKHVANQSSKWKRTLYRKDFILALRWFSRKFKTQFNEILNILSNDFGVIPDKASYSTYQVKLVNIYNEGKKTSKRISFQEYEDRDDLKENINILDKDLEVVV